MDFHPLALLRLAAQAIEQAIRVFSDTFTTCSIAKHRIGQTDFYPLTLDGSTICNQLGLGGDQGLRRRWIHTPRQFDLQASQRLLFFGDREARSRGYDNEDDMYERQYDVDVMRLQRYEEELIVVAKKTRLRRSWITYNSRYAGHDIIIAFPLRHELRQTYRCRYKCSLVKNLPTQALKFSILSQPLILKI